MGNTILWLQAWKSVDCFGMLIKFLPGTSSIYFFGYIEALNHLERRVRSTWESRNLQNDNFRPNSSRSTELAMRKLKIGLISHVSYSPGHALCYFIVFLVLKLDLKSNHYTSNDEVKATVKSWIWENNF